ncbi:thiamine kinase [Photorhabdus bodei]|uniref:Thiamine kinase n=1 Tax=Photorhabdus bodei TaxID=2029681 RepID=A0A329XCC6_9GAMM|nr:thiamine kinase [Photorhabdus bodei]NDK97732.1 thiamine kinase [Photorhabdus bodei]NDL01981.1 thiamine kinase [Photorhabdus bodei]NDL06055.1 thiamine kinase [Photorhabdus bodei]RAX14251.1 thiamine kinase [Photorhabdus bodei]
MTLNNHNCLLQALRKQWPHTAVNDWKIRPLSGLTNESYYATNGEYHIVGRRQGQQGKQLGVNRQRESAILRHLSQVKIAPQVIAMVPHWLLLEWLPGHIIGQNEFSQPDFLQKLAALLAILHHQPLFGYRLQLRNQLESHWLQIDKARLTPCWLRLHKRFMSSPMPSILKLSPAHMDVHYGNLLNTSQGLKLIDWEYATDTDIGFALAALFRTNHWDESQQQDFLNYYCSQSSGYSNRTLLERQIKRWLPWVDYMILMWFEVRWKQSGDPHFLELAQPLRLSFGLTF